MSAYEITMGIRSDISQVAMVGRALSSLLSETEMSRDRVALFELAVVEVVTNSIEHAYQFEKGYKVDLSLRIDEGNVVVTVTDYGSPMPVDVVKRYTAGRAEATKNCALVSEKEAGEADVLSLPEGGWGTSLVGMLCDDVSYRHHKTSNIMTLTCELQSVVDQAV